MINKFKLVDTPEHIVVPPVILTVGAVFTATVAEPETVPEHCALLTLVKVYNVLVTGVTDKVYGDEATPVIVLVVVPSE